MKGRKRLSPERREANDKAFQRYINAQRMNNVGMAAANSGWFVMTEDEFVASNPKPGADVDLYEFADGHTYRVVQVADGVVNLRRIA